MKVAKLGNKFIGDGHPCFISLEAGATHGGFEDAKLLVKAAAEGGADAIKFQTVDADELMSEDNLQIEFETPEGKRQESIYQALKRRELKDEEWRALKKYADSLGLLFISTPSGERTIDLLAEMKVAAIKVAKADINNRVLIKYMASKGLPIILDAREKFEDVEEALKICEAAGIEDIVVMHCPSGYPAEQAGIHLSCIPHIKSVFGRPVAYSDHSLDEYMNFAALGVGTNMIEKTITSDRATDHVEHYMSLEPEELRGFIERMRSVEEAMGTPRIIFNSRVKADLRRSVMVKKAISAGDKITLESLCFKRPGIYFPVDRYEEVVGSVASRDLKAGEWISESDFN